MTWRDDVANADDGTARPAWEILDGLRAIAFTGAVEFPLTPPATVYLDRGRIYFAEREDDATVADRLVAAGAVRPTDVAAGVLVVGEGHVDHLGRLFVRVPSLDRQRVMLSLELLTEETVAWVARQSVRHAVTQPYRYHASGVHQWYDPAPPPPVAPAPVTSFTASTRPAATRPAGDRAHIPADLAKVRIEWSEPVEPHDETPRAVERPAPEPSAAKRWDPADWHPLVAPADQSADVPPATDRFEVVWPSGDVGAAESVSEPPSRPAAAARGDGLDRFDGPLDGADLDYPSFPDDDVDSHEVAIAVRRAIAAVESGGGRVRQVQSAPSTDHPRDSRAVNGNAHHDVDDDPSGATSPGRAPSPSALDDDQRRTALKRLIDAMRGR